MADPRLERAGEGMSMLERVALWSGWAAAVTLLVFLFWFAVTSTFGLGPKILAGVTVALTVFWASVHWRTVIGAAGTRGARLGTGSAVFVLFVLGSLILCNVIASRHAWRKDLTEERKFSLSEQTEEVVRALDEEVTIVAFLDRQSSQAEVVRNRLREYNMLNPKLSVKYHDPFLDVDEVKEYSIMQPGTIVVESGDKQEKVYGGSEEDLTSAILAVSTGEKTNIYFLIGHGEVNPDSTGDEGISMVKGELQAQQYAVKTLNLLVEAEPQVPGDCAVLVIAGPTQPLRDDELSAITSWADQGGKLLVCLEPGGPDLAELLEPYGVKPMSGTISDPGHGLSRRDTFPMAASYGTHQITQPLGRLAVALPLARPLELIETMPEDEYAPDMPPQGQQAQPLLETSSEASVAESPDAEGAAGPGGPLVMAAAVDAGIQPPDPYGMQPPEEDENALRMVVVGDGEFMMDKYIRGEGLIGNFVFTLAAINWLVENEKLISIPPKEHLPEFLTMNERQQKLVRVITIGIVPLLIGIAGFIVWWRRR